ncbi:MAG: hypothetical protein LBL98_05395, partial [Ruminococcus sp.]|nr:hypothetical protein [Ruminococcus sp.]
MKRFLRTLSSFMLVTALLFVALPKELAFDAAADSTTAITLTPTSPSRSITFAAGQRVQITVTGGSATVESSNNGRLDPKLYRASTGTSSADDDGGEGLNWQYAFTANQTLYAGTYNNGAGTYTVTATFDSTTPTDPNPPTDPDPPANAITLTAASPTRTIAFAAGQRVQITVSGGSATVQSSNNGRLDPTLYSAASGGTRVAD